MWIYKVEDKPLMPSVDDYLKKLSPAQKAAYLRVRKIVLKTAPGSEEVISYGIPTFKHNGKHVLYFGAFKHHMSLFPGAPLSIKHKLTGFKLAKGTIQFTEDTPVPEDVIKEIVSSRMTTS